MYTSHLCIYYLQIHVKLVSQILVKHIMMPLAWYFTAGCSLPQALCHGWRSAGSGALSVELLISVDLLQKPGLHCHSTTTSKVPKISWI